MARNPALDRFIGKVRESNTQSIGSEEEAAAAREAAEAEGESKLATVEDGEAAEGATVEPEQKPVETREGAETEPEGEAKPAETAAAGAETGTEGAEKEKPADGADTRQPNRKSRDDRLAREAREAKSELARQRAENQRLGEELAAARQQPAVVQPAVVAAKEQPKDPEPPKPGSEPDGEQFPVEHDRWEAKTARYEAWQARQESQALRGELNQIRQGGAEAQAVTNFDGLFAVHEQNYAAENPSFTDAHKYLEGRLSARMRFNGMAEHLIPQAIRNEKRMFLIRMTQEGQRLGEPRPADYALQRLYDLAELEGYVPEAGNGNGKPARSVTPKTAEQQLADGAKRTNAARAASTMSAVPVGGGAGESMTADKWIKLTPAGQAAWKKAHPGFSPDEDLLNDSVGTNMNPILQSVVARRK